ncbi:hypothetical protein PVAP13_7NG123151 [Panicum virgatum]|uniref:Uncharacterized protein n=1 Tax=Panicum virgatum TaxID=38727 RepID=A0A8T0PVA5_PANVG|nr:hypothetical protein PVAP13_7NG123151 [Panicum virgatum]
MAAAPRPRLAMDAAPPPKLVGGGVAPLPLLLGPPGHPPRRHGEAVPLDLELEGEELRPHGSGRRRRTPSALGALRAGRNPVRPRDAIAQAAAYAVAHGPARAAPPRPGARANSRCRGRRASGRREPRPAARARPPPPRAGLRSSAELAAAVVVPAAPPWPPREVEGIHRGAWAARMGNGGGGSGGAVPVGCGDEREGRGGRVEK